MNNGLTPLKKRPASSSSGWSKESQLALQHRIQSIEARALAAKSNDASTITQPARKGDRVGSPEVFSDDDEEEEEEKEDEQARAMTQPEKMTAATEVGKAAEATKAVKARADEKEPAEVTQQAKAAQGAEATQGSKAAARAPADVQLPAPEPIRVASQQAHAHPRRGSRCGGSAGTASGRSIPFEFYAARWCRYRCCAFRGQDRR